MGDVWRPDRRFPCRSVKRWTLLIRKRAASVDRAAAIREQMGKVWRAVCTARLRLSKKPFERFGGPQPSE